MLSSLVDLLFGPRVGCDLLELFDFNYKYGKLPISQELLSLISLIFNFLLLTYLSIWIFELGVNFPQDFVVFGDGYVSKSLNVTKIQWLKHNWECYLESWEYQHEYQMP